MTSYENELKRFLSERAVLGMPLKGYAYRNWYEFLNQHGEFYQPRVKPAKIPWGAPKACFANAMALGIQHGWKYVEGMAFGVMPLHHAWNLCDDGRIIDATWRAPGKAYFGVAFNPGRADDALWSGDATVLDDVHRDWPLLKEPWTGEDFTRKWDVSEATRLALQVHAAETDEEIAAAMVNWNRFREAEKAGRR